MKTKTSIGLAIVIIVGVGYFVMTNGNNNSDSSTTTEQVNQKDGEENSVVKDGIQYVTIVARNGYTPRKSIAKAGLPTKLILKTEGTYDCSTSLVIRSLNYRQVLPSTGETSIDVGVTKQGQVLQGVCSMGMYSFAVTFK